MKYLRLLALGFGISVIGACQKKDDTPAQPDKVVITVTAPAEGQVYHMGDTVNIAAAVSYISQLHGYTLRISDKSTDKELYYAEEHVHNDKFDISKIWVDNLSDSVALKLVIVAEIDHNGNEAQKEINIKSKP